MAAMMEPLVDTLTEDARWEAFGLPELAEAAGRAALAALQLAPDAYSVSLLGCADTRIAALNADFRGKPQPTNVLSWPSEDRAAAVDGGTPSRPAPGRPGQPAELGDVALAFETCLREAENSGKPVRDHVTHLVVHGILHLLGYDHIRDRDAALMEALEARVLASLGLADPYGGMDE